jgi:hypothetical protein
VGIFDADVYGPSLPTMVSPEIRVLRMDPATKALSPTEYEGVKLVSFGFAGQGAAIMRGAMVSGLIQQMLTTSDWGARARHTLSRCSPLAAAAAAPPPALARSLARSLACRPLLLNLRPPQCLPSKPLKTSLKP